MLSFPVVLEILEMMVALCMIMVISKARDISARFSRSRMGWSRLAGLEMRL